jgi:hypothetical protein
LIAASRGRAVTVVLLTSMIGAAAAACTAGPAPVPSSTLGPVPDDVAAHLSVEVGQGRTQYADREILLEVTNGSDRTMTLLAGSLHADGFGPSHLAKVRPRALPPGVTRDVYLGLGDAQCAGVPAGSDEPAPDAAPSATITLALGEGDDQGPATDIAVDEVTDTAGHLARNHAVDCAQAAVESGVRLTVEADLPVETRDGEPTAFVAVRVEPVDGGPEVSIDRITETTLMDNPDARGSISGWTGRELDGQRSGEIILPVVPARCDAHAVGEDKRGTFLPVEASVGGTAQHVFYLPMPDAARAALYGFIGDSCGWPAAE